MKKKELIAVVNECLSLVDSEHVYTDLGKCSVKQLKEIKMWALANYYYTAKIPPKPSVMKYLDKRKRI